MRGRFDIVVPFGGGYLRLTSDKTRSLTADEIAEELRDLLDAMLPRRKAVEERIKRELVSAAPSVSRETEWNKP